VSIVGVVLFVGLGATAAPLPATEGLATAVDGCGAVTVLEVCAGVEAVGVGVGKLVGEEALVDPPGT